MISANTKNRLIGLSLCLSIFSACITTPDLTLEEAASEVSSAATFTKSEGHCISAKGTQLLLQRKLLNVIETRRADDSEKNIRYAARIRWQWTPAGSELCKTPQPVFTSWGDFHFDTKWKLNTEIGDGLNRGYDADEPVIQ